MTGNKLEKEIIGIFNRDVSAFLSINQIAKELDKAYPYINSKVNELIDEKILTKVELGRSYNCSINLENGKAVALLSLNEADKKEKIIAKIKQNELLKEEIKTIRKEFGVYTIILNKSTLIFVLDHLHDQEAIKNLFTHIKKYDLVFFDKKGFQDFVLRSPDVLENKTILYSFEKYFELIAEIKNNLMMRKMIK